MRHFTTQSLCYLPKSESHSLKSHTWHLLEDPDRLVHGFVGLIHVLLYFLSIDGGQRVVHPAFVPALPVGHGDPEVFEWLEILD